MNSLLIYTAGLVFLIRTFGSGISQKSALGTLIVCSVLTFVGLFWLGGPRLGASPLVAFMAATLFGIGKTYFSPTMMGVAVGATAARRRLADVNRGRRRHALGRYRGAGHGRAVIPPLAGLSTSPMKSPLLR
jgi:hypothetical protein